VAARRGTIPRRRRGGDGHRRRARPPGQADRLTKPADSARTSTAPGSARRPAAGDIPPGLRAAQPAVRGWTMTCNAEPCRRRPPAHRPNRLVGGQQRDDRLPRRQWRHPADRELRGRRRERGQQRGRLRDRAERHRPVAGGKITAGTPRAVCPPGMSLVTTAPAPSWHRRRSSPGRGCRPLYRRTLGHRG
jgi:hypothetical protein